MGEKRDDEREVGQLWEKWDDEGEVGQYCGRSGTMREKWDSIVREVGQYCGRRGTMREKWDDEREVGR